MNTKLKPMSHLNLEIVLKIRVIHLKRWGRLRWKGFMEKASFESGVEERRRDA